MIRLEQVRYAAEGGFELQMDKLLLGRGLTILVGPNGAGKTTLLKLLATAVIPGEGSILYGGYRLQDALPLIRRNIGYMPSGLELYEEMTPFKLLRYLAELKGMDGKREAELALEEFGLAALRRKPVKRLSHGQRQSLGIAQAMLGHPPFLFLDEPLHYLDSLEQKRVLVALFRQAGHGTVLVTTHELNEWEPYADRVLWLEDGRIADDRTPLQWKTGLPMHVFEGSVPLSCLHQLDSRRMLRIVPREDQADVRIMGEEPPTDWFRRVDPTLEDAYFIRRFSRAGKL